MANFLSRVIDGVGIAVRPQRLASTRTEQDFAGRTHWATMGAARIRGMVSALFLTC